MKKILLVLVMLSATFVFGQASDLWQKQAPARSSDVKLSRQNLPTEETYSLDIDALKNILEAAPERGTSAKSSNVIISFPNEEGVFENYRISTASVLHPELAARYPDINSYAGQGVDNPAARIRFSVSPLGLQTMRILPGSPTTFIEPYTNDLSLYTAYKRSDKTGIQDTFECQVKDNLTKAGIDPATGTQRNADDALLRTYRLAISATGEYTDYHGGTKAGALAAMNTTMTRVNGVYETDFNVTMIIIANTDDVIYTNSGSDPYGNTTANFNNELQNTLTSVIGEANYDVGHLFARNQNNGNAGCIGCVCRDGDKGSGWTSRTVPENDPFDIDYVAHELGHQFGGNHTWTHGGNEGRNVQMEPGSGSTIMGYAGITGATDVQPNSDPYFHAVSIQQITAYIKSQSCSVNTNTGNAIPTANAGANYTIPKGTPFVLTGAGADANAGDVLTYGWEQYNENNAAHTTVTSTRTSGPVFRSFNPTTDNKRYFPRLSTIKTGATSWQWEAVPTVARTMDFRLTVRDNRAGGGANNSDDTRITVNGTAGPFILNSPNTAVTWNAGTVQTVTWNVAGTTANGVNAANVDIFLSTDGGDTYPVTLASGVTNDGSHDIVVPDNQGTQNRIMVRGSNHIFFDISNTNFTIGAPVNCTATAPLALAASNVGSSTATLSWDAVLGATYDVRFRESGTTTWTDNAITGISLALTALDAQTTYEAQVRSRCSNGNESDYSASINFTTTEVQLIYCDSNGQNTNDEFISRVQLADIDNTSGAGAGGYSNFTGISTDLTKGDTYTISVTPTWTGTLYNEAYAVWIDYNKNGVFTDTGEQVFSQAPTQATPVSGSFTIPAGAANGATRMRVSMKYNAAQTSCESFQYGEVEDYTVNIGAGIPDTTAPVIALVGSAVVDVNIGDSYTDEGATATDNEDGDLTSSITTVNPVNTNIVGTYTVTYNVSDAAGNEATEVTREVNVLPDTIAPVITLTGPATINLFVGQDYVEQGATAVDNLDGVLTSSIVTFGTVDTASAGTYTITYNVSDAAGNAATEVLRTIIVTADTTAPVITLIGNSTIDVTVGEVYNDAGATATDNVDGDLTASIAVTSNVNTANAGTYTVTYNVNDAAGNAATAVTRTVTVTEAPAGCTGGVDSFPYAEGFESNFGAWTQSSADDLNWSRDANGTPSNNTGPASASEGNTYIYVEASGNGTGFPNKRAILNSPCFNLGGLTEAALNFKYHMFGATDMGSIDLEISTDLGTTWTSIWNQTGNKGNQWNNANVDLSAYVGSAIQLRFNRLTGGTWQADLALDAIQLNDSNTPAIGCTGGEALPYAESYEANLGAWSQAAGDDLDWTRDSSGTPSNGTGPSSGADGSFYLFVEASGNNTGYPNKRAIINSPCVDLSSVTAASFNFSYHMLGTNDLGSIALEVTTDGGASWTSIWSQTGNQGNQWNNISVDIDAYAGGGVQFRFNRLTGNTWQADVAIDNVAITTSGLRRGDTVLQSPWSSEEPISIEEAKASLYPNPVSDGILNINITGAEGEHYTVYSITGQVVAKGTFTNRLDVSKLQNGVYMIEIKSNTKTMIERFVKR